MVKIHTKVIGWLMLILSLGHFYYLYPSPSQRVEQQIQSIEQAKVDPQRARLPPEAAKIQTEAERQLSREAIEAFVWQGWYAGLAIVVLGAAAGLYLVWSRDRSSLLVAMLFCLMYAAIYWTHSVDLESVSIGEHIGFRAQVIEVMYKTGRLGGLVIEIHQIAAAIVFHLVLLWSVVSTFWALRSLPE